MANIKSAKKRISTIDRRTAENKFVKATLSTYVKKFRKMLEEGKIQEAEKFSKEVYAYIDSACSKGIIHKNAASRKIGRLASSLYKAKVTVPAVEKSKEVVKVEEKPVVEVETVKAEEEKTTKKATTRKTTTKNTDEKPAKKTTKTKKAE